LTIVIATSPFQFLCHQVPVSSSSANRICGGRGGLSTRFSHWPKGSNVCVFSHSIHVEPWIHSSTFDGGTSPAPDCSNLNRSDHATSGRHRKKSNATIMAISD